MNDSNNNNNGQGNPQYLRQDLQYSQSTQNYQQPPQSKGAVTGGEMFVGINLLSKIGVVFIIIGIIAFSAASEGFLHVGVRLALVIALGLLMLGAGELFYRKGSPVFANALIFGGVAELFICSLIGHYGFHILSGGGSVGVGLGAAAVGFLLSARYRSQGLLIVTVLFSALPIFSGLGASAFFGAVIYLVAVHAANAVISRKSRYDAAYIIGIVLSVIETLSLFIPVSGTDIDDAVCAFVIVLFVICCAVCYAGGLLLNAAQEFGKTTSSESALICIIFTAVLLYTEDIFHWVVSPTAAGIALLVLTVIFTVLAVIFSLNFGDDCKATNILFNFMLIAVTIALMDIAGALFVRYILLHILAAAVIIAGLIFDRRLFRGWGFSLTALAEIHFFGVLLLNENTPQRLVSICVNLVLWFGIMVVFIVKKKHQNNLFRAYTFAAFLNAGLLCSDMIIRYLVDMFDVVETWINPASKAAFSALLCTVPWLVLGFVVGKLKYMRGWAMSASFTLYIIGLLNLLFANGVESINRSIKSHELGIAGIIATIAVNAASVLPVLDMAIQISGKSPKFSKAVGLVVSAYSLLSLTTILGTNNYVTFTSFIISIIYIVAAAVWIIIGFKRSNALLRRFGLALALLSSAKLFLFDFRGIGNMGRTLLFIGFGVTLLCIAFGYGIAEKRLKERGGK
ncbi:MAG: DUF2339 domain-containing protein [Ruminococcaceae bacterium]|nr:DUF2339 domain-containing protein [Oscillospiraceae bacterium]